MSAIALSWVATVTVGNQTAKQLLQFYASHNFGKPGFEFKNSTLSRHLEVSERAIQKAHKLLIDKKFIIKEIRFNENGRQIPNAFYLNIPESFVDNFMGEGERSSPLGANVVRGEGERSSPHINNKRDNTKKNNKEREKLPADFVPSVTHVELANKFKLDLGYELEKFRDWAISDGIVKKDWGATFNNWLRRSSEYKNKTKNYKKEETGFALAKRNMLDDMES